MAVDFFLEIDGIKGESKDATHGEQIDLLNWGWGLSQSASFHFGGGGGSGKVAFQDLHFVKRTDLATPPLMLACANGDHIKKATLYCRKAGKTPLEYIVIEMEKIIVSSLSQGGSNGEDVLTESCSFNFAKCSLKYVKQSDTGGEDTSKTFKWDIEANKGDVS